MGDIGPESLGDIIGIRNSERTARKGQEREDVRLAIDAKRLHKALSSLYEEMIFQLSLAYSWRGSKALRTREERRGLVFFDAPVVASELVEAASAKSVILDRQVYVAADALLDTIKLMQSWNLQISDVPSENLMERHRFYLTDDAPDPTGTRYAGGVHPRFFIPQRVKQIERAVQLAQELTMRLKTYASDLSLPDLRKMDHERLPGWYDD